jgi:hypothetical protein
MLIASGIFLAAIVAEPSPSGRIALVLSFALDFGMHQGPLTAGAHERDDVLHQRIVGKLARDPANSVGKDTIAKKSHWYALRNRCNVAGP